MLSNFSLSISTSLALTLLTVAIELFVLSSWLDKLVFDDDNNHIRRSNETISKMFNDILSKVGLTNIP